MRKGLFHQFGSMLLAGAVLIGATAFYPLSAAAQDNKNKDKDKNSTQQKVAPTPTNNKEPLSTKENPALIGKRNINGGSDKFFGWLGGSQSAEIRMGRELAAQVEQQVKLIDDPIITEYINRVGQNIVLHSDAKVPFTIKVIDSEEVNAFALPGGFFYVNKGLILAADSEAELAGVMAHEIAHVAARHSIESQGKLTALNYGVLAGLILGGPITGTILQNTAGLGQALAFFKFSRSAEEEADKLGVQYLYASGYDPTGLATMFEKLASRNKKKPNAFSKLFTTHPLDLQRRETSLALVARFPEKEEYVISTSEFQRVKAYLLRTTNAKAGVPVDFDENEPGKPTLKKRQPDVDGDATDNPNGDSTSNDNAPPKLKKRGDEPSPTPSPSPEK